MFAAFRFIDLWLITGLKTQDFAFHIVRLIRFFAMRTQYAHQALCDHTDDIAGHDVWQNANIRQSWESTQGGIGMQRTEYLMTSHRRTKRHGRRVFITDLTNEDNVRVLAHDRADT